MVRCRSINILILAFLLGFAGALGPQLAFCANNDVDDLSFEDDLTPAPPVPVHVSGKSPWTVGILGGTGMAVQGSKSFTTTDQLTYNTSGFNGSLFNGGLFLTNKWSSEMAFRLYLSFQSYRFTGSATEVGVPVAAKSVLLTESMGAGGFEVLYYFWSKRSLWVGGGLEYARGLSLDITLDGIALPTTKDDFTNYLKFDASLGWDIPFLHHFVLTPFIRVGDIISVKPTILVFEGEVALGYRL